MTHSGPTHDSAPALRLLAGVLGGGILLWPQPAWASTTLSPQWVGAGIALAFLVLLTLVASWILRKPSSSDSDSGLGQSPQVATAAPPAPPAPKFADSRLGRLQQGISRRRQGLKEGKRGFSGDTEVMSSFLEGCARMQRGEAPPLPPERQLPPGTLNRLERLYEQLLGATPARARDWPLQRTNLSAQIRTALGQRDTNRLLELLDALAKRRVKREQPTQAEAASWSEFLTQFHDTGAEAAPLAAGPEGELAIAEDVPTSSVQALGAPHASEDDAPTVDTDLLFPSAPPTSEEDAPTVDTDLLFVKTPSAPEEDAPTVDTEQLFPSETAEEDAPTVDTENLFPGPALADEDAPTVDTENLFPEPTLAEEDAPTVDTENLFPTRKISSEEEAPTVDTFKLFDAASSADGPSSPEEGPAEGAQERPSGRRKRLGARPPLASFTETDELLDPVEDAPTRDTADLFRNE